MEIYAVKIAVTATMIHVAPIRSLRVGQATLTSSALTSPKKTDIFVKKLAIALLFTRQQERQESNLQSRFWRPVVYR